MFDSVLGCLRPLFARKKFKKIELIQAKYCRLSTFLPPKMI